jgi:hypothetical protein
MTHRKTSTLLALSTLVLTASSVWAQHRHPMYLHARSDLRRAVLLMRIPDEPNVTRDMQQASGLVERAIREVDAAAMFDRRDIEDNPPVDTRLGRGGRFREIIRLLESARHDIGSEEDNPRAAEWRNRAFGLIDDAMAVVRKGGYDKLRDDMAMMPPPMVAPVRPAVHPRYAQAVSDLRYARALLFRPDWREVMRDQRAAVEEIDRAIGEAKRAAIDDGKNPDDHPPIEARMGWGDRFRKSMELLDAAQRNLSFEEDNRAAAGWRAAAMANVNNAKAFIAKAQRAEYWH